jgi:malonyl-CoA O-methyltransferase
MQNDQIQLNKKLVRQHFDRHAFEYDRYAVVQGEMADQLMVMLEHQFPQKQIKRILEIGCGTGILTEKLHRKWSSAHITAVDISQAMIEQTKLKLGEASTNIRFITADAEEWAATNGMEEPFDLIISNATFQWFQHPSQTIKSLLSKLQPSGSVFAFSTFGPRTFHELHSSFLAAETLLSIDPVPHGQAFLPRSFWRKLFANLLSNSQTFKWEQRERIFLHPSVRDFLTSIKRVGAGNATRSSGSIPQVRQLFKQMEAHYLEHFSVEDRIQATYDLGYGIINLETISPDNTSKS